MGGQVLSCHIYFQDSIIHQHHALAHQLYVSTTLQAPFELQPHHAPAEFLSAFGALIAPNQSTFADRYVPNIVTIKTRPKFLQNQLIPQTAVIVLESNDIIFSQVAARLYLDEFQRDNTWVFQAVRYPKRDIS